MTSRVSLPVALLVAALALCVSSVASIAKTSLTVDIITASLIVIVIAIIASMVAQARSGAQSDEAPRRRSSFGMRDTTDA